MLQNLLEDHPILVSLALALVATVVAISLQPAKKNQSPKSNEKPSSNNSSSNSQAQNPKPKQMDPSSSSPAASVPSLTVPDRVFTAEELSQYAGGEDKPIYVAIKGIVFDVTGNRAMYSGGEGSYGVFSGRDASILLAKSALRLEHATGTIADLNEKEIKTLEQWFAFFAKKYPVVGRLE